MNLKYIFCLLFSLLSNVTIDASEDNMVDVTISGLRSKEGKIRIHVYKDDVSFQKEKPFKIVVFDKQNFDKGVVHLHIELEFGACGLSLLDDENNNAKMDYNFISLPKEGFGFSNFYLAGFSKPHYNDFEFIHTKNKKTKVVMKVRYI